MTNSGLKVLVGLNANISCLKGQDAGHPQQGGWMQAVMMVMMTSMVELLQSLLEDVALLPGSAEQPVLKLVEYPES